MITNMAAVQMTPDAFIAAGSAGLGVGARSVVPSRLELVVDTVMPVPYRGQAIQPSGEQAENACSSPRIRYNVRSSNATVLGRACRSDDSRRITLTSAPSPYERWSSPEVDNADHHHRRAQSLQSSYAGSAHGWRPLLGGSASDERGRVGQARTRAFCESRSGVRDRVRDLRA